MTNRFHERLRILLVAGAVLGAAAAGIACGGDDSSSGGSSGVTPPPPGTTPPPPSTGPTPPPPSTGPQPPPPPPPDSGTDAGPTTPAATPNFAPPPNPAPAAPYTSVQHVTISDTTPGATIYYTTDGTNPTVASQVFTTAIDITKNTTIRAMAAAPGFLNSSVGVGVYVIQIPATKTTPVDINPKTGQLHNVASPTMSSEAGAAICYTLDGTAPTCAAGACTGTSATYNAASPPTVSTTGQTVKAIACAAGKDPSDVTSATYTYVTDDPSLTPGTKGGTLVSASPSTGQIELKSTTAASTIKWSTSQTVNCLSTGAGVTNAPQDSFIGPFTGHTVVNAIACRAGFADSAMVTYTYDVKTATPGITHGTGTYNNDTNVNFTGSAAHICVQSDPAKADPTCTYTAGCDALSTDVGPGGSFPITANATTVRAVACSNAATATIQSDAIAPQTYTLQVGALTFACTSGGCTAPAGASTSQSNYNTTDANPSVAVHTDTYGAVKLRYTTNGSAPTPCTTATAGAGTTEVTMTDGGAGVGNDITLNPANPTTLKAIACKAGYLGSVERDATFANSANTPTFSLVAGPNAVTGSATGTNNYTVSVANLTPASSTVCYTVNTNPAAAAPDCDATGACSAGTTYTGAFPVTDGQYVTARACNAGLTKSATQQNLYHLQVSDPQSDKDGSGATFYPIGTKVTFSVTNNITAPQGNIADGSATAGATLHYNVTTDGTTPAPVTCATGTVGTGITLTATPTKVSLIACKAGYIDSTVLSLTYSVAGLAPPVLLPGGQGGGSFTPLNLPHYPQQITISAPESSGIPNAVICYQYGDAFGTSQAACNASNTGCQTGTSAPVTGSGSVTFDATNIFGTGHPYPVAYVDSVVCAPSIGSSPHTSRQLVGRAPAVTLTNPPAAPFSTGPQSATMNIAAPPAGATQATGTKICYTLDGTAPNFGTTDNLTGVYNSCGSNALSTVCVDPNTTISFDETTEINAQSCNVGYFASAATNVTYQFVEYSRTVANYAGFSAAENAITTSSGNTTFDLSWDAGHIYLGLADPDLAVDSPATALTQHFYFRSNPGAAGTTTPDTGHGGSATTLPTTADHHIFCSNGGANATTCTVTQWTGTQWNDITGTFGLVSTRTSAPGTLYLSFTRAAVGLANAGVHRDDFAVFGVTMGGATNKVGFPQSIYTNWVYAMLNSYHNPNAATNIKP